jgi:hypothetical protein
MTSLYSGAGQGGTGQNLAGLFPATTYGRVTFEAEENIVVDGITVACSGTTASGTAYGSDCSLDTLYAYQQLADEQAAAVNWFSLPCPPRPLFSSPPPLCSGASTSPPTCTGS